MDLHHINKFMLANVCVLNYPYWFPAKRNVSRSNKHSIEVVVKYEDSPVDEHDEVNAPPCSV